MILAIGLIVGFYVATRMLQVIFSEEWMVIKVFAVVTLLMAILGIADLLMTAVQMQNNLQGSRQTELERSLEELNRSLGRLRSR